MHQGDSRVKKLTSIDKNIKILMSFLATGYSDGEESEDEIMEHIINCIAVAEEISDAEYRITKLEHP